jgi:hypothetical protein
VEKSFPSVQRDDSFEKTSPACMNSRNDFSNGIGYEDGRQSAVWIANKIPV